MIISERRWIKPCWPWIKPNQQGVIQDIKLIMGLLLEASPRQGEKQIVNQTELRTQSTKESLISINQLKRVEGREVVLLTLGIQNQEENISLKAEPLLRQIHLMRCSSKLKLSSAKEITMRMKHSRRRRKTKIWKESSTLWESWFPKHKDQLESKRIFFSEINMNTRENLESKLKEI